METHEIVIGNEINISSDLWNQMNSEMSKDEIKKLISDAIEVHDIPLPYRDITLEEAKEDFEKLCDMDCLSLIKNGNFFTRYEYEKPLSSVYVDQSNIGNKSSDFFHQEMRWKCDSINSPSPHRTWNQEKFRLTLLNGLWSLKYNQVNMSNLRSIIGLRKYIAAQFRPSAAKAIYQHFKPSYVLDFSTGWGDRLSGFLATKDVNYYYGCDPNAGLFDSYNAQIETYLTGNKKVDMNNIAAEDCDFGREYFDLVFTSPPYFIIERYTQEKNQSWKRYNKIEKWLDGFLITVLRKSWEALSKGGYMVINISDVYCNHTVNKICDPMNQALASFEGSEFVDCWGLRMSKRPNSKSSGDGIFGEPIWIWKKN